MSRTRAGLLSKCSASAVVGLALLLAACTGSGQGAAGDDVTGVATGVGIDDVTAFAREHGLLDLPRATVRIERVAQADDPEPLRFTVLVADTPEARGRGLQGVTELPDGVGMLFAFPEQPGPAGRPGFWMLDTLLPLDIAFFDAGRVVGVATMSPCAARPCPITHPGVDYDLALEVAGGTLVGAGVTLGDRLVVGP